MRSSSTRVSSSSKRCKHLLRRRARADLTPQGRFRASVTDDPDFEWRVPSSRFLVRSTGEAAKPDTAGQEQVARTLTETLGHFGIEAKVIGRVTGPHITRYELRLAPGDEGRQGRPAQGRPGVRAGRDRHPDPRADPGQAGGGGGGPERPPADRQPGRRVPGAPGGLVAAHRVARQGHRRARDRSRPRRRCRTCSSPAPQEPASRRA